ncbi:hypothetical protein AJ80_07054 [Polytolypa hystricis UAMH7299]|uniref:DSBA-like thioredoxin domain-containing protein n=1 Tax=Polytolypa hystricis (strain UAMH7299) TaxID=1447883 RepID=A0A2B7XIN0_POLH7|nr:hypothetical protein AJ80_07054 [Polytolypa hystricis UAMH7299]
MSISAATATLRTKTLSRMVNFDIRIVSDTVCPWCYIGKKRLEKGIQLYRSTHSDTASNDTFSITWLPFYLNPSAPLTSVDKQEYFVSRFGAERARMITDRITQVDERSRYADARCGRVIALSFENEGDITSLDELRGAGVRAGLDEGEVREWLESEKGGAEVDAEVLQAKREFVSGVPNFSIQGKFHIEGADSPEAFVEAFEKARGLL